LLNDNDLAVADYGDITSMQNREEEMDWETSEPSSTNDCCCKPTPIRTAKISETTNILIKSTYKCKHCGFIEGRSESKWHG